jgi:hypothetical protein
VQEAGASFGVAQGLALQGKGSSSLAKGSDLINQLVGTASVASWIQSNINTTSLVPLNSTVRSQYGNNIFPRDGQNNKPYPCFHVFFGTAPADILTILRIFTELKLIV